MTDAEGLWERLLEALETGCGGCGGSGTVRSVPWRAWHERAGELVRVAQAARRAADLQAGPHESANGGATGSGNGGVPASPAIVAAIDRAIEEHVNARPPGPERVPCPECGGLGRVLTAAGGGLAQVLVRHGLLPAPDLRRPGGGERQVR